ncbi:alpha/beta hydrolase [Xylophilus sp. GW821-FHT01B05]
MSTDRDPTLAAAPAGLPAAVPEQDIALDLPGRAPVAARLYGRRQPGGGTPLVLHFHGGAFVAGGLDNGAYVARLLARAGAVAVSLAYPLAPEHPFPEPVEIGFAALEAVYRQRVQLAGRRVRLYLAGEEAGGNLAASVALIARDRGHPPLAGQILVSPMLDPCTGTPSLRESVTCDNGKCKWTEGWQAFLRSPMDAEHPYAVPGSVQRLTNLAPTLVLAGDDDPMRDEAMAYAERLRSAGIAVTSRVLSATDNWPDALFAPEDNECACGPAVLQQFQAFFEVPEPRP